MSGNVCVIMTKTENSILDILIHVFILASILSIFFLLVIVPIEKSELNNEVHNNIKDSLKPIINQVETKILQIDSFGVGADKKSEEFIKRLHKYYEGENEVNKTYNEGLVTSLIIVLLFLLTGIIVIYFAYKNSCGKCPPIFSMIGENLLLFAIIGIIEYLFFIEIASKYIPVKPSLIIDTVNSSLD
jgi:hypothetical protein